MGSALRPADRRRVLDMSKDRLILQFAFDDPHSVKIEVWSGVDEVCMASDCRGRRPDHGCINVCSGRQAQRPRAQALINATS